MTLKLKGIDIFDAGLLHGATHFVCRDLGRGHDNTVDLTAADVREEVAACEGTRCMVYAYQLLEGGQGMVIKQVGITPRLLEAYDQIYGKEVKL